MPPADERRCDECQAVAPSSDWARRLWQCPACGFAGPMPARERLRQIADPDTPGEELDPVVGGDPLSFRDSLPYPERLARARAATGLSEAFVSARAQVGGVDAIVGALDFRFLGGSMSPAVGERVARVFDRAADEKRAVVLCTASGGARMQEGTLSLFQMTKTVAALSRFRRVRRPYVSVLGHPTLGGVAASFAALADVILAEPGARIGFAGPRVIEQLLGHPLPEGFQRAEFVLEHGFVDRIVPRDRLREELARLLALLAGGQS